jgi:putative nucleotidyltransferase with HDIG domain
MQSQALQEPDTLSSSGLENLQVIVVDDEPTVCNTLELFLRHLGVQAVSTACNGEKGLERIQSHFYDYAFVDLMMPEINGMEILKDINQSRKLTSVIIMTGYPSMDLVIEAMHNGASDFLVKPFRFQDVKLSLERIQRLHKLMKKNWLLTQELEKKKEVEGLNVQLATRIRHQMILYNIVDSLSKINRSESLYDYIVTKAVESCNAKRACFMIYDQGGSSLLVLSQQGFRGTEAGIQARVKRGQGQTYLDGIFLENQFGISQEMPISLQHTVRHGDFMAVPFRIREEPFGILLLVGKEGKKGFDREDEFILNFLAEKSALNIENIALYDNLKQSLIASLMSLVSAIEAKDAYTQQHSSRVTEYAIRIAEKMGCDNEDFHKLKSSGPLHDIGKIGINDSILNKPDRLSQKEFQQIKTHPLIGVNIVSPLGLDPEELAIIRNHHERWDGKGYPDGLGHEHIPRLARILAVADAFDAMNSSRAYRKALPLPVCLQELRRNSGLQFDPQVVQAALSVLAT